MACGACAGEGATPASGAAQQAASRAPLISQSSNGPVAVASERCGSCSGADAAQLMPHSLHSVVLGSLLAVVCSLRLG